MKRRLVAIITAAAMIMCMLAGCGSGASGGSTAEGTSAEAEQTFREVTYVNTAQSYDPSPFGGVSYLRLMTRWMVHGTLFCAPFFGSSIDDLQPRIAKSINKVDPVTAEIELFDYVKDSKGNPIKASDVVFSYEMAKASGNFSPKLMGSIASVEATGDYTLTLKAANQAVGTIELIVTGVPIISQEWYENAESTEISTDPAVTGAYKIGSFTSGGTIVFDKVEDFWQKDELRSDIDKQPVDRINAIVVTEGSQRVISLENQEADVSMIENTDAHRFMDDDGNALEGWTVKAISSMPELLLYNCSEDSVFGGNEALRKAIAYAIDAEMVRQGAGNPANFGYTLKTVGLKDYGDYNTEWDNEDYYEYNVEKAKELLAEAGYAPGELTVNIMTTTTASETTAATVIQGYLDAIGVTLEINSYDQALFNTYMYDQTQWDMMLYTLPSQNGMITDLWLNTFDARSYSTGTLNYVHDDQLQELLIAASEQHSKEDIDAMHEYLKDKLYVYGLFGTLQYYVAQDGIEAVNLDGMNAAVPNLMTFAEDYQTVVKE